MTALPGGQRGGPARGLLVPEVLQTSALDCGPAALAALLGGFGLAQPFERLREACGTGRDGTSIDAIEAAAVEHGLDAEQILVPADHLAVPEAGCLPCVLVVRQAGGASHFVVVWRRHGRRAQVMDPAAGRRWPRLAALDREVYRHRAVVPAAAWQAWASSGGMLEPLGARLAALGVGAVERRALLEGLAREDGGGGWRGAAALDAAVRFTRQLVAAGGVRRGRDAGRILAGLVERVGREEADSVGHGAAGGGAGGSDADGGGSAGGGVGGGRAGGGQAADGGGAACGGASGDGAAAVPVSCWSVRPAAPGGAGEERVTVEGAVLVRVRGRRRQRSVAVARGEKAAAAGEGARRQRISRRAAAASAAPPEEAGRRETEAARRGLGAGSAGDVAAAGGADDAAGLPSTTPGWIALGLATLGGAAGRLVEVALLAACVELLPDLGSRPMRLAVLGPLLCLGAALLLCELTGGRTSLALGRGVETALRLRLAAKLPRLPDRYLRTRLAADLAERAHLLARARRGPELAAAALGAGIEAALAAAGIAWLDPRLAAGALAAGGAAVAVPLVLLPRLEERSRRAGAHAAALGGFCLDALRGLAAVHAHQAAPALRRRHDELLAGWLRARRAGTAAAGWLEIAMQAVLSASAAGLVVAHVRRHGLDPQTLVLALWAAQLLGAGQRLAVVAGWDLPLHRSLMRRLAEPLAAAEEPAGLECAADGERGAGDGAGAGAGERTAAENSVSAGYGSAAGGYGGSGGRAGGEEGVLYAAAAAGGGAARRGGSSGGEGPGGVAIGCSRLEIEIGGRGLLHELDLDIPAGQHVAILGRSGAGKSTLLGCLLGWHRPAAGRLLADGRPLDARGLAELRRVTAWVAPEVTLWSTPVLDNLCYGLDAGGSRGGAGDGMTPAEALRAAQLLDLVQQLPDGLQTALGEAGGRLSGGEGQRLRLARALLRPGVRLALLDEAFRGLDADQRRELLAAARGRWRRATLLYVTHSPAEAAGFDRLVILDGGRIAEDGVPGLLGARRGSRYRALLDAEGRAGAALGAPGWRRLRLAGGRLHELPGGAGGGGEIAAAVVGSAAVATAAGRRAAAMPAEVRR